jgi:hypothetical protein
MSLDFKKQEQTLEAKPCTGKSLLISAIYKRVPNKQLSKKIEQTIKNLSSLIRDVIKTKNKKIQKNGPRTHTFYKKLF